MVTDNLKGETKNQKDQGEPRHELIPVPLLHAVWIPAKREGVCEWPVAEKATRQPEDKQQDDTKMSKNRPTELMVAADTRCSYAAGIASHCQPRTSPARPRPSRARSTNTAGSKDRTVGGVLVVYWIASDKPSAGAPGRPAVSL